MLTQIRDQIVLACETHQHCLILWCKCEWVRAWCVHACVCCWLSMLQLKGVARQSKSQRLLARPAASVGLRVSVSEVVHCTLFSLWLRKSSDCLLCLLKWNVPMVPPSHPQVLCAETFPWRVCMFTGVWQIYSSLMDHAGNKASVLETQIDDSFRWFDIVLNTFKSGYQQISDDVMTDSTMDIKNLLPLSVLLVANDDYFMLFDLMHACMYMLVHMYM